MRTASIAAALLATSGCISFGGKTPDSLITLTPAAAAPAGTTASGNASTALALAEFDAPRKLDVTRVPVQVTDSTIAYVKDAVWNEKPARLLGRLIAETIRARSGRLVIDGDDPGAEAETRISGTVREFGYDARTSEVVLVLDAARSGAGSSVTTRRFEARVPGVAAEAGPVGVALNQAANQVASEVAAWVG
ncbi:ABC-type transport auxiliary lipoprotein family protein [Qipengyuania sediminis]|uniref:ABC-type transport auxiliary lipoprotein family protein n=1 Tax=Qipengyuania sediminis TaxID=1532023 RepID=UPI00105A08EA|nr:ABC-type transport auxiliary lipoprotein family protein [Qipengyuania sediminis]